jgi:hypothetical protein
MLSQKTMFFPPKTKNNDKKNAQKIIKQLIDKKPEFKLILKKYRLKTSFKKEVKNRMKKKSACEFTNQLSAAM